jgi:hypothetical protein
VNIKPSNDAEGAQSGVQNHPQIVILSVVYIGNASFRNDDLVVLDVVGY